MNNFQRLKDKTILLVEDENVMRRNISSMLQFFFKEVYEASDGISGMQEYYKNLPDIVMTDLKMPNMDGFEFLKSLKEYNPNVFTVVVSAHTSTDYFLEAIDQKVDKYLIKPITEEELFSAFEAYLKQEPQRVVLAKNTFFDIDKNELEVLGEKIPLNKKEAGLMKIFCNSKDNIVSYEEIEYQVWGDKNMSTSALRSVVRDLRKKLIENVIENVSGTGYRFSKIL